MKFSIFLKNCWLFIVYHFFVVVNLAYFFHINSEFCTVHQFDAQLLIGYGFDNYAFKFLKDSLFFILFL